MQINIEEVELARLNTEIIVADFDFNVPLWQITEGFARLQMMLNTNPVSNVRGHIVT